MKIKSHYVCSACGKSYPKWMGCCTACNTWDSVIEEQIQPKSHIPLQNISATTICSLDQHTTKETIRFSTHIDEWDRVLGGGLVKGSFVLLAGDPGIGKSTMLLQMSAALIKNHTVLYLSSEESVEQVALRAKRITNQELNKLSIGYCSNIHDIIATIETIKPDIVIIDSLQNCQIDNCFLTSNGNHIRNVAHLLLEVVKKQGFTLIVTGHITKEGAVAGPKMLEHLVDVVLQLHGEESGQGRILRASKNRFGSTEEIGLFAMDEQGLTEKQDAQSFLIENHTSTPGSALTLCTEGSRDFMIKIQALTVPIKYGNPQRVITGMEHKQLILVCAVLERYLRLPLHAHDVFCKISGTFRIKNNEAGCALACAILSSYLEKPIHNHAIILGELGLSGDITCPSSRIPYNLLNKYGIKTIACPMEDNRTLHDENNIIKKRSIKSIYDLPSLLDQ